jgi:hypothetical protein
VYTPVDLDNFNDIDDMLLMEDSRTLDSYNLADGNPRSVIYVFWEGDEPGDEGSEEEEGNEDEDTEADPLPEATFHEDGVHGMVPPEQSSEEEDSERDEGSWKRVLEVEKKGESYVFTTKVGEEKEGFAVKEGVWYEWFKQRGHNAISKKLLNKKKVVFFEHDGFLRCQEVAGDAVEPMTLQEALMSVGCMIKFPICINMVSGKQISLEVEIKDSIGFIKTKIQEQEDIPFEWQKLLFIERELRNGSCIEDLGPEGVDHLKNGGCLTLVIVDTFKLIIVLDPDGPACEEIELRATMNTTIRQIKKMIADDYDIKPEHMRIFHETKKWQYADDNEDLAGFEYHKGERLVCKAVDFPFHMTQEQIDAERAEQEAFLAELDPADRGCNQQ